MVTLDNKPYSSSTANTLTLNLDGSFSKFLIDLKANEPNQPISVSIINSDSTIDGFVDIAAIPKEYPRTVDIRDLQYKAYRKASKSKNK